MTGAAGEGVGGGPSGIGGGIAGEDIGAPPEKLVGAGGGLTGAADVGAAAALECVVAAAAALPASMSTGAVGAGIAADAAWTVGPMLERASAIGPTGTCGCALAPAPALPGSICCCPASLDCVASPRAVPEELELPPIEVPDESGELAPLLIPPAPPLLERLGAGPAAPESGDGADPEGVRAGLPVTGLGRWPGIDGRTGGGGVAPTTGPPSLLTTGWSTCGLGRGGWFVCTKSWSSDETDAGVATATPPGGRPLVSTWSSCDITGLTMKADDSS